MIPLREDNTSALGFINKLINNDKVNKATGSSAPNSKNVYLGGSLSNYAKNLIMTFPCMCDNSIPISTASMISKANERYIITMLEMLFASAQMHGNSGAEVIASVHKNIKSNFSVDDYLDALDNYVGECKQPSNIEIATALREMVNELKKPQKTFPTSSFSENSVYDYDIYKRNGRVTIQEDTRTERLQKNGPGTIPSDMMSPDSAGTRYATNSGKVTINQYMYTYNDYLKDVEELDAKYNYNSGTPNYIKQNNPNYNNELNNIRDMLFYYNDRKTDKNGVETWTPNEKNKWSYTYDFKNYNNVKMDSNSDTYDDLDYLYKKGQITKQEYDLAYAKRKEKWEEEEQERKRTQEDRAKEKHEWERQANQRQALKDRNDLIQKRLLDGEVKKANELQPTLMIVNFNTLDTDGKIYGTSSFVAGVKSRLISVDSIDIIERIAAKNKTKINFSNFIKATTGEIRFIKDFLLSVDQAKIDAKNASKKGIAAMMWKTLENRSIKNNWNRIKRSGNDASAITVLIVSQETVNSLLKYYNFDLNKIKNARFVMETYNLMGIIICDESIEAAKFLYAGNDMWETQAYSYLEKEGKQANDYKKTINLLNKGAF